MSTTATIQFDKQVKSSSRGLTYILNISLEAFDGKLITEVSLSDELIEKIDEFERIKEKETLQIERELTAKNEFKFRKAKYQVSWFEDNSPLSELNRILIFLDEGNNLSDYDIQWLNSNCLFQVLGYYYEKIGYLARAGSNWRKSDNPQRALAITENITKQDSYILTMRGAAFKDIGDLDNAKESALSAIRLSPNSFYPYNLLGAIFCQQGMPEEGFLNFEKAILLGSKRNNEDGYVRSALKEAGHEERIRVAKFLLEKDPIRYKWANIYLK